MDRISEKILHFWFALFCLCYNKHTSCRIGPQVSFRPFPAASESLLNCFDVNNCDI